MTVSVYRLKNPKNKKPPEVDLDNLLSQPAELDPPSKDKLKTRFLTRKSTFIQPTNDDEIKEESLDDKYNEE